MTASAPHIAKEEDRPRRFADLRTRFRERLRARLRERRAIAALVLLLGIFGALTIAVKSPQLRLWDADMSQALQRTASPMLTRIAVVFTDMGGGMGLALCAVLAGIWLLRIRRPIGLVLLLLTIGGHLLNLAIKAPIARPRPLTDEGVEIFYPATGTSFPSGHAMTAVMFFGFWAFLVWVHVAQRARRRILVAALTTAALAVCVSRIYLGAHFVSDIIGGIAAGLLFLFLWAEAYHWIAPQEITGALAPKAKPAEQGPQS